MNEEPRALEVGEKLVAEPRSVRRSLDQPGHVGDRQLPPSGPSTTPRTGSIVVNG